MENKFDNNYWTELKHKATVEFTAALIKTNGIKNGDLEGFKDCITNAGAIAHAMTEKMKAELK